MKNVLLLIAFLCSNFFIGQSLLVPPDNVIRAFEKQYPDKKPIWDMELGKNDEIKFVAAFKTADKKKKFVTYDSNGVFKTSKKQIAINQLPLKGQKYLKKNYNVKTVGQILAVVDNQNQTSYMAEIKSNKSMFNLVFDANGEFIKRIEIKFL
jgi:hypothetical protein